MLTPRLEGIIDDISPMVRSFGDEEDFNPKPTINNIQIIKDFNNRNFQIVRIGIVILFFCYMLLVWRYAGNPGILTGLAGVMGSGLVGLIVLMFRISREVTQTEILLDILEKLPPQKALDALLSFRKSQAQVG